MSIYHASSAVKTPRTLDTEPFNPLWDASIIEWFKYSDKVANRRVTMAVGYSNGIACSQRTRAGKLHESNGFNVRDDLLNELKAKGYHTFLIRITWQRSGRTIHYATPINTIYQLGTKEYRYDGWQWSLPLYYWSIDGEPPAGPALEPKPLPTQGTLFDFVEPQKVSAY